jgi:hypothetical protein
VVRQGNVRDHGGHLARGAGERDTQQLADGAVPAVARDKVTAANVAGGDAVGVLLDCRHLVSAKHRYALADEALFEEIFEQRLWDGDRVRVTRAPWPTIQLYRKPGEMPTELAAGQHAVEQRIQQPTQVEHLGGARLQPGQPGICTPRVLLFQHHSRYPGQREFMSQHQAGRAGPDHDHLGPHVSLPK